jgi:hypothetical protein
LAHNYPIGVISSSDGYNITLNITSTVLNYDAHAAAIAAGWPGVGMLVLTINIQSGVIIGSSSTGVAALTITGFPSYCLITVNNYGTIIGCGGAGGTAGSGSTAGSAGVAGGPAITLGNTITINNYGSIYGGGGGGGGGGAGYLTSTYVSSTPDVTGTFNDGAGGGTTNSDGGAAGDDGDGDGGD